jgi:hypothetical protein
MKHFHILFVLAAEKIEDLGSAQLMMKVFDATKVLHLSSYA